MRLENKFFKKIICGASNNDYSLITRLCEVYSLAGIDIIDIPVDIEAYDAALKGILRASEKFEKNPQKCNKFHRPILMLSVNADKDIHFRKAFINTISCSNCGNCIDFCNAKAIYKNNGEIGINQKKCYGCGKCEYACPSKSIEFNYSNKPLNMINNGQFAFLDAVEIHTGNLSADEILKFVQENHSIINKIKLVSYSISASNFNSKELVDFVESLINLHENKIIVQVDGNPMGTTNSPTSSLMSIAMASCLMHLTNKAYIQIAGGINYNANNLLNLSGISISGIGFGTYARKILSPYLNSDESLYLNFNKCLNIATNLVDTHDNLKKISYT